MPTDVSKMKLLKGVILDFEDEDDLKSVHGRKMLSFLLCAYITRSALGKTHCITAIDAPGKVTDRHHRFCCRGPRGNRKPGARIGSYHNIQKDDVNFIPTVPDKPIFPIPQTTVCLICSDEHLHGPLEREWERWPHSLHRDHFALPCRHFYCRTCWLEYCKRILTDGQYPIPCPNDSCDQVLAISQASTLFDKESIGIMRNVAWRKRISTQGSLKCADCKMWMIPTSPENIGTLAECVCGCVTCVRCKEATHVPLPCEDCAPDSQFQHLPDDSDGLESKRGPRLLFLLDNYDAVTKPIQLVKSDRYRNNIKFRILYDRKNGNGLEKCMKMVARLLVARKTQILLGRESMELVNGMDSEDVEKRWTDLESQFNAGLLQEGETRAMAEKLIGARDAVLGCYYS
ncbi:hypothetical protein PRIPAC_72260 [Pristionchus pacificus]|uniref:Uncharacterized protein n=1 Tax=Pristionchus pacificus TaxID=54126 RepID=A0A2A6BR73_PRIPA|nr:hypothetical protein PRIPAC_72260 [Pristionchus pacificus]|eukprot:PDM68424.1 hypothetical protein PRIPAC_43926 [Pristionchus pacificus]